jgi:hypothetical protein
VADELVLRKLQYGCLGCSAVNGSARVIDVEARLLYLTRRRLTWTSEFSGPV